jgi:holo-ACP synthase/triphosphoribosyl-dephospho-CoA synthase
LKRLLGEGWSFNDAGVAAFLELLSHTEDTCVIHRGGAAFLKTMQAELRIFLDAKPGRAALLQKAGELDSTFIAKNISPGGCADLLSAAFFLYWIDK